ncbi:MAG: two-component sensor histidine kinase [Burkholderiaceae bacterium]|nr:MAG: two-component sensor histidine kinase [Burkholderiaceae bacterium]TAM00497.1 MAG: two-component sensor histidine kinase [Pusillimonas sp.]
MASLKRQLNDSIQLKLSFVLATVITIVAVAAGAFSFFSTLDDSHERQDDMLYQVADLASHVVASAPQAIRNVELLDEDRDSSLSVQVLGQGSADLHTASVPIPIPSSLQDGLHTLDVKGQTFRVLVHTIATHQRIAVAQDTDLRDTAALKDALRTVTPFLILVPILLIAIADIVRRMFRPILKLSRQVDSRPDTDLSPVGSDHLPREIQPFVRAINRLLVRVAESMETQRRFIADAAHELRSPAAALSLQAERLGRAEMSDAARDRLQALRRGLDRNQHLLSQLLALAKVQSMPDAHTPTRTKIQEVIHNVLETVLPLAEAKRIDIGVTGDDNLEVPVSELNLTTLIRNLTDNAIRYTPEGGRVDLSVTTAPDAIALSISDSGPGVPATERDHIFEPFYRVLGTGQAGSGLGLSIVAAIVRKIGARIELSDADETTQSGLCITLTIPINMPLIKPGNEPC